MSTRLTEIQSALKEMKPLLERQFQVREIAIFGSYLAGTQRAGSDLDLLVDFAEPVGLFDFVRLEDLLTEKLGVKVDLVMRDTLKPRIKDRITREALYV